MVSACRTAGANFSLTLQCNPKLQAAIDTIDEQAWTPVRYPGAVFDADTGRWISDAEVAETTYTAFERAPTGSPRGWSCAGFASSIPHQPVRTNCSRSGGIKRS